MGDGVTFAQEAEAGEDPAAILDPPMFMRNIKGKADFSNILG